MAHAFLHSFSPPGKREGDYIKIVRAEGSTLWDESGKTYIDGLASLWYCQIGHGRSEMARAVAAQMEVLATYNTFDPFTNDPAQQCAEMVAERSPLPDSRVFLSCSGSEAIDTAIKIARLTQRLRGEGQRQVVVKRTNGYHGTNFGGTSAQGIAANREGWGDLVPHFVEVPHDDLEALATVFARDGDRIAAVLTEPVQGAGGVFLPPPGYLTAARRLCDEHGALLIFDEVISGFGRTGSWFAAQTFGTTPDLITFAKGVTSGYLPLSGVIVSSEVSAVLEGMEGPLRTGYTYSGHPTCSAAAIENIRILEAESLIERARHIGALLEPGLGAIVADGLADSCRGVGAVWGIDLGRDAVRARQELLNRGVVVRLIGEVLAVCPPLVITDDELETIVDTVAEVLSVH